MVDLVSLERRRVVAEVGGPSMTRQADAESADINVIMRRYSSTGVFPLFGNSVPRYGDFYGVSDYHSEVNRVMEAEAQFSALPPELRAECSNDVGVFLEKCSTSAGLERMLELGLEPGRIPAQKIREVEAEADLVDVVPGSSTERV